VAAVAELVVRRHTEILQNHDDSRLRSSVKRNKNERKIMKNKIDIKSLVLGVFLGAVVVFSVAAATTGDSPALEYKTLRAYAYAGQFDKQLNELARDGWAVVSSSTTQEPGQTPYAVVIVKRAKK
jgi:hypothetical protein